MSNDFTTSIFTIIQSLVDHNIPIVIKGGNALEAALNEANVPVHRMTTDIDGNWIGIDPDINTMRDMLEEAVQSVYPDYHVTVKRKYESGQSAGFTITDSEDIPISKFDIDVNKQAKTQEYHMYGFTFYGVSIEDMLSDKISAISSHQIFRRSKDLLDVYAITKYITYDMNNVIENLLKKPIGDFEDLYTRKDDIEYAYEKMSGIENKPDFNLVYDYVINYCGEIEHDIKERTGFLSQQTDTYEINEMMDMTDKETRSR